MSGMEPLTFKGGRRTGLANRLNDSLDPISQGRQRGRDAAVKHFIVLFFDGVRSSIPMLQYGMPGGRAWAATLMVKGTLCEGGRRFLDGTPVTALDMR